jgi:hypothetical protein
MSVGANGATIVEGPIALLTPRALEHGQIMDQNYRAFLRDLPELKRTHAGQMVAYFDGELIASAKTGRELADQIPAKYVNEAVFIKNVEETRLRFRRPFLSHHA